jgi:very-short-patch-repair endonuclease
LIHFILTTFEIMKNNNLINRKSIKTFRSHLRNRATSAEVALWNILKSRNLDGKKFRRQYSIDNYIVDFCCPSEKLIIELDGAPHGEYDRIQKDENRDKYIESLGFTVIRFENRVVFQEPEYLKNEIRKVLNK